MQMCSSAHRLRAGAAHQARSVHGARVHRDRGDRARRMDAAGARRAPCQGGQPSGMDVWSAAAAFISPPTIGGFMRSISWSVPGRVLFLEPVWKTGQSPTRISSRITQRPSGNLACRDWLERARLIRRDRSRTHCRRCPSSRRACWLSVERRNWVGTRFPRHWRSFRRTIAADMGACTVASARHSAASGARSRPHWQR